MMPYGPNAPFHCRRFVYGYSLDGSDFPCYFLWPHRTQQGSFWLLEFQTRRHIDIYIYISLAPFLRPLGLQHFYDAFGLKAELSIRVAAMEAFHLQEGELSNDLIVSAEAAVARGWTDHVEQPIDQNAPEADLRNVATDVISVNDSEVDSASSAGDGSSDGNGDDTSSRSSESSGSEPPASEVSDQHSMLEHAYEATQDAFHVTKDGQLQDGIATLRLMEIFPPQWPLARLTLPLKSFVHRLGQLIALIFCRARRLPVCLSGTQSSGLPPDQELR